MAIVITCPNPDCGRRYSVPDEAAGRTATCATCGAKIQIGMTGSPISQVPPPPPPPGADDERHPPRKHTEVDVPSHDDSLISVARPSRRRPTGKGGFGDFVLFRTLIAPWVMIILYWVVVVLIVLGSLGGMAFGFLANRGPGPIVLGLIGGLLGLIVGPFLCRIIFESAIVVFRIYDTLVEIRDHLSK